MTNLLVSPAVSIVNGRPSVSSLKIAEHFDKQHAHVLRDIRRITAEVPEDFSRSNFGLASYIDEQGKERDAYDVSQDGFILVAMGYTGKQALQIKLVYIAAFNSMREQLSGTSPAPSRLSTRTDPERKALTAAINAWVGCAPIHYAAARSQVNAHFGAASVDELTVEQVREALQWVQGKIDDLQQPALSSPKRKALPASSHPAQAKADALLAKVKFYIGEIDAAGTQVQELLVREYFLANPDAVHDLRDTRSRMNAHVSCTTRFLWSSVNSTLSAVEDSIKLRLENCM